MKTSDFLEGMSRAASTVSIVTSDGPSGRSGVTISAMTSVSVEEDEHSLLVCVHHLSPACEIIRKNGIFCVNVLKQHQTTLSDVFAGRIRTDNGDKFSCASWQTGVTGGPLLHDALVSFDCELKHCFRWGGHYVLIGHAVDVVLNDLSPALVYANRSYSQATPLTALNRPWPDARSRYRALNIGCFVTLGPYFLPGIVRRFHHSRPAVVLRLMEGNQDELIAHLKYRTLEVVLTYRFDLPDYLETHHMIDIPPYVLLSRTDALADREVISLSELESKPMVVLDIPPSRDYFISLFSQYGLSPDIQYRASSFEMVRGLVGQGLGFSLLATRPVGDVTYDGNDLVVRPLAEPVRSSSILVVTDKRNTLSDEAIQFIKHCRTFFETWERFV